jgi:hypothetical protein
MNLPNFLTVIRLILIPFCGYALYNDHFLQAGVIFVMACITDYADGKIARKYNMVTNFGKLADPAADKLLLLTALFILAVKKLIPMFIPVTVLIKETIMGIGGLILLNKKYVVSANIYGRIGRDSEGGRDENGFVEQGSGGLEQQNRRRNHEVHNRSDALRRDLSSSRNPRDGRHSADDHRIFAVKRRRVYHAGIKVRSFI